MPASFSGRVVKRLSQAEACEHDPHFRDDLRIARLTVHYAATGEAIACAPDVLATYMVLGLHPNKVWPAIEARRSALMGWGEVSVAATVPKKPPQSVKLWSENTNAARALNSRGAMQVDSQRLTTSVPMSLAALCPKPDDSGSAKERPFFKREELEKFFETCPLDLISYPEWRTLRGMWIAAGKPFGSEVQFFKAIKHYREAAPYRSEATVRANIRKAEDKGFLEVPYRDRHGNCHHIWIRQRTKEDRGLYRRVTTHRLSIPLLLKWRALHHKVREMPTRKPDPPPTSPKPPTPAAPQPQPQRRTAEAPDHRSTGRSLTSRQRKELHDRIRLYEFGRTEIRDGNGYLLRALKPGNPEYIKPLPHEMAILAACQSMARGDPDRGLDGQGVALQKAREAAMEMEDEGR